MKLTKLLTSQKLTWPNWLILMLITIILASVYMRWVNLSNIPGINGDEAEYGVRMLWLLERGEMDWFTYMGNVINPFYYGLVLLSVAVLGNQALALRLPAALVGTALIGLTYWLVGKMWGKRVGVIASLIMAVMPINIAYSRFGWDTSQTTTACLILLWVGYQRRWWWLLIATAGALLVHPTNIFILPTVMGVWLSSLKGSITSARWKAELIKLAIMTFILAVLVAQLPGVGQEGFKEALSSLKPQSLAAFWHGGARFITGAAVYRFISGSVPGEGGAGYELAGMVWIGAIIFSIRKFRKRFSRSEKGLLLGFGASVASYMVMVGEYGFIPGYERYGLWVVVPLVIVTSVLLNYWIDESKTPTRWLMGLLLVSVVSLVNFKTNYFDYIKATGGTALDAFVTAEAEPKLLAVELIERESKGEALVFTEDWWVYWPIQYFSLDKNIQVEHMDFKIAIHARVREEFDKGKFLVGFDGEMFEEQLADVPTESFDYWEIDDYSGREIIKIWKKKTNEN